MPIDFWGVVFPNYISAFGGLAATVLAIVSLVLGVANRRRTGQVMAEVDTTRDVLADTIEATADVQAEYNRMARDWIRSMKGVEDPDREAAMRDVLASLPDGGRETIDPKIWEYLRVRLYAPKSAPTRRPD